MSCWKIFPFSAKLKPVGTDFGGESKILADRQRTHDFLRFIKQWRSDVFLRSPTSPQATSKFHLWAEQSIHPTEPWCNVPLIRPGPPISLLIVLCSQVTFSAFFICRWFYLIMKPSFVITWKPNGLSQNPAFLSKQLSISTHALSLPPSLSANAACVWEFFFLISSPTLEFISPKSGPFNSKSIFSC